MTFASVTGCAGTDIVFVREDVNLSGDARSVLKLAEPVRADAAFFDGAKWTVVTGVDIPAGWLVVSPKILGEEERGRNARIR